MIGIIGAMPKEVEAIKNKMNNINTKVLFNHEFIFGEIKNKKVVVCKSGVGKVNASVTATIMIITFNPQIIVNIGTAGGLVEKQNTLDIVISKDIIQHDYDTSYIDGELGIGIRSSSDYQLRKIVEEAFIESGLSADIYIGDIISGDLFVGETEKIVELKKKFPTAIACEMEAGAIAQTCEKLGVPFIVVRSLSDIVFNDNSGIDFMKNVEITSKRSAEMDKNLIVKIK